MTQDRPGAYVRERYGVPAFIGRPVVFTWRGRRPGKITGFDGSRLIVKLDGEPGGVRLHPTWEVEYPLDHEGLPLEPSHE